MRYLEENTRSFRVDDDGSMELMCNFVAKIVRETKFIDGLTNRSLLTIEGEFPPAEEGGEPVKLPAVEVTTDDFGGFSWVMPHWGIRCVIRPGSGIKDDLRTMIQLTSTPELRVVYKQTGWQTVGGQKKYLHAGGAIGKKGNDPSVEVRMPHELRHYDLRTAATPMEGIRATLALLKLAEPSLTWPMLAATLAPLYGPVDFALHLTGRTGSFKSEVMSLFQSHYGAGMDARNLPGSWSSTPNALEALAFFAANAPFVVDDFVPAGSAYQQKAYQQNADKLFRAQGNQAGRARLTDTSNLQQTMYPRGIILSTGEDTPEGHSVRARMLILEVRPGEVSADKLTTAQKARPLYPATIAWLAQSLAETPADLTDRVEQLRVAYREIGHSRTPSMLGRLVAVAEDFLKRCLAAMAITPGQERQLRSEAKSSIEAAGAKQQSYLEDTDPVDVFFQGIRQVLASGGGHFRTLNGGVPRDAAVLGFTEERAIGEMTTYKARGPVLGWVKPADDEMYLDMVAGYNVIKKATGSEIALGKMTLVKRIVDAGKVSRKDDGRQRNTIRITAENHPRQVLCLSLSQVLDKEEVSQDETDE